MAATSSLEAIEGILNEVWWFHYDIQSDVFYLRQKEARDRRAYGEENEDGVILLRDDTDTIIGMTIVAYWKRFGIGDLAEATLQTLRNRMEAWAESYSLAA